MQREEENPFLAWVDSQKELFEPEDVVYIPNEKAVEFILKKSGVKPSDFNRKLDVQPSNSFFRSSEKPELKIYLSIQRAFMGLWKKKEWAAYDEETSTVEIFIYKSYKSYKVTGSTKRKGILVRFINGWVGTPSLGKFLVRFLKGDGGNSENPFNVFVGKNRYRTYLPDITYLPELYKQLGVEKFEDIPISGPIEWENFSPKHIDDGNVEVHFYTTSEHIDVLWREKDERIIYLNGLPKALIDKLKALIIQKKRIIPPTEWEKDPFQAIVEGNLVGKDLIALCNTSKAINAKCNANDQELFKIALRKEFGMNWSENTHDFPTPRELYKQMHTYFDYILPIKRGGRIIGSRVDYYSSRHRSITPSMNDNAVILVPSESMKRADNLIVVFHEHPHLSFYLTAKFKYGFPTWYSSEEFGSLRTAETKEIRKLLDEKDLLDLAKSLLKIYIKGREDQHEMHNVFVHLGKEELAIISKILPDEENPNIDIIRSDSRIY